MDEDFQFFYLLLWNYAGNLDVPQLQVGDVLEIHILF
jgi:hypothetical protein